MLNDTKIRAAKPRDQAVDGRRRSAVYAVDAAGRIDRSGGTAAPADRSTVLGVIGGEVVGQTAEGLARYPINVRYPRELRADVTKIRDLPVLTPSLQQITLGTVADVQAAVGQKVRLCPGVSIAYTGQF